jgi:hypothetical protein
MSIDITLWSRTRIQGRQHPKADTSCSRRAHRPRPFAAPFVPLAPIACADGSAFAARAGGVFAGAGVPGPDGVVLPGGRDALSRRSVSIEKRVLHVEQIGRGWQKTGARA